MRVRLRHLSHAPSEREIPEVTSKLCVNLWTPNVCVSDLSVAVLLVRSFQCIEFCQCKLGPVEDFERCILKLSRSLLSVTMELDAR